MDTSADREEYDDHLARSQDVWDRRSSGYDRDERELARFRNNALDALPLEPGDRVLEIGCGPGTNFERVIDEIGTEGEIVGIDYSPKMVERARTRCKEHGWDNVTVIQTDATTFEHDDTFDAVISILALSVLPDKYQAVETLYANTRPGGHLVVFDVRPIPRGLGRVLNPLVRRLLRWYANYNPTGDGESAIQTIYDQTESLDTAFGGIAYTIAARKDN